MKHELHLFAAGFFFLTWVLVFKEHKKWLCHDILLIHLILNYYMPNSCSSMSNLLHKQFISIKKYISLLYFHQSYKIILIWYKSEIILLKQSIFQGWIRRHNWLFAFGGSFWDFNSNLRHYVILLVSEI